MSKNTTWTIVIIVVLVILGITLINGPKEKTEGPDVSVDDNEENIETETETNVEEDVQTDAEPGSPSAPKQSGALSEEDVPKDSIKLEVAKTGFTPKEFDAKAGDEVTLAVTSADQTHVFKFDDPSLQGIAIGLAGDETRTITFTAPEEKGDYTFYCDVPGHRSRGETGVMHVK